MGPKTRKPYVRKDPVAPLKDNVAGFEDVLKRVDLLRGNEGRAPASAIGCPTHPCGQLLLQGKPERKVLFRGQVIAIFYRKRKIESARLRQSAIGPETHAVVHPRMERIILFLEIGSAPGIKMAAALLYLGKSDYIESVVLESVV